MSRYISVRGIEMALPAISPTGQVDLPVSTTSANVLIPATGTPTQVLVTNLGPLVAFVLLGTSNAIVATVDTGTPVLPYSSLVLTLTPNTYIAAITQGNSTVLRITAGT